MLSVSEVDGSVHGVFVTEVDRNVTRGLCCL